MNIFKMATNNIHEYTETVSDYIGWCTSICVPTRTVRIYPNQKPWFNADIRRKIRKRCDAFRLEDREEYKKARYELQRSIKAAKRAHSQKLESLYLNNNTHSMWQGIQAVTNYKKKSGSMDTRDTNLPDCLNSFYARFNQQSIDILSKSPRDAEDTVFQVTHTQVLKTLKKVNPCKAAGPDGVPPRVLRTCAEQLAGVYADIFNTSLSLALVPHIFKSSVIVPVPKKTEYIHPQ